MIRTWAWAILGAWPVVGVATAFVLRRRGHDLTSWAVLGVFFGPLTVPIAIQASRVESTVGARILARSATTRDPAADDTVAVLAGHDGSAESEAALQEVLDLLGPRVGKLTIARVVDYEAAGEDAGEASLELRRQAEAELREVAQRVAVHRPATVMLGGEPARALSRQALDGGDDLLVVGRRGRGLAKALLGSTSAKLVREAPVPVLVGSGQEAARTRPTWRRASSRARSGGASVSTVRASDH